MHIMHMHRQRLDVHALSTRLITAGIVAAIVMTGTLTAANAQAVPSITSDSSEGSLTLRVASAASGELKRSSS
jgi:hypothetical protein